MSGVNYPVPPAALGVKATALALSFVLDVGRSDRVVTGRVQPATWDAIDALVDALIELLPEPERRAV